MQQLNRPADTRLPCALDRDHDLTRALGNTPWIDSFWSVRDRDARLVNGAGSFGFSKVPNRLREHRVDELRHSAGVPIAAGRRDAGAMGPPIGEATLPFVSLYMGRRHAHKVLEMPKPQMCVLVEKPDEAMHGYTPGLLVHETGIKRPEDK